MRYRKRQIIRVYKCYSTWWKWERAWKKDVLWDLYQKAIHFLNANKETKQKIYGIELNPYDFAMYFKQPNRQVDFACEGINCIIGFKSKSYRNKTYKEIVKKYTSAKIMVVPFKVG